MNLYVSTCTKQEDKKMQEQSIWQICISPVEYTVETDNENCTHPIFRDQLIEISCDLRSIFGLDEMYIYQYNASSN